MKTFVLSTVCGLALLAISTTSTAQAADLADPIRGDRFSYSQIGDIKGEHPVALDGVNGECPFGLDGVDGEYPIEYDGIDGELPLPVWVWLYF